MSSTTLPFRQEARNPVKVFAAAAWEPELTRLRALAAGGMPTLDLTVGVIGVGPVESAIGMTRRIAEHRPDIAVLLGTCGAVAAIPTGTVVVASSVRLFDTAVAAGDAELPPPMPGAVDLDRALHDALVAEGARSVRIANTAGITITDAHASRLLGDFDVEHLEAFGFARACAIAGVRCAIVLAVANPVGARGRGEWRANHDAASGRAGEAVHTALFRMSTTTP